MVEQLRPDRAPRASAVVFRGAPAGLDARVDVGDGGFGALHLERLDLAGDEAVEGSARW
jgi:hypothetical protein